jgi:sec-independent protein translocase protein TatC
VVLFAAGVAMSYYLALPVTLRFLLFFAEGYFDQMLQAGPYLGFVTKLLMAFGVLFELPVVIMILSALGLVTPAFLRAKRRHAIVIITVLASFLSPGDVVTVTAMMMLPLVLLYEFSILLSVVITRKRRARDIGGDPPEGSVEAE